MFQTKYASAVPKNWGLGLNFQPYSEGYFLSWLSVVRGLNYISYSLTKGPKLKSNQAICMLATNNNLLIEAFDHC